MRGLVVYLARPTFPDRRRWFFRTWRTYDRRYVAWGLGPYVLRLNWPRLIAKR